VTFEFVADEHNENIGIYLKRVRQGKELTLADVANHLKIHEKYLAAIEANDDTLFPDRIFKELFVKSYCEYLGVSLDDLLTRLPEVAPVPLVDDAKPAPRPVRPPESVVKAAPVSYGAEETKRSGGRSFLVVMLVVVIVVLGFFLVKLTFDSRPPAKVVIPQAIPKSEPKKQPAVAESLTVVADSTDTSAVVDSAAVDSVAEPQTVDSVLLLIVGKGRSSFRIRQDSDTGVTEGMIRANDTLWFGMQDSIYLRFWRANAVDLFLNALPLKIADGRDTSVVSLWISRDNYLMYVDSSRLSP
jgi:cytoskeletal protein RodZ